MMMRNWNFMASSASGLLVTSDAIYFGSGIWKGSSDYDTGLTKYSLSGNPLGTQNLSQLGLPVYQGRLSLAGDGKTYWICSEASFDVHHVSLQP
jgi:hypothetical protein